MQCECLSDGDVLEDVEPVTESFKIDLVPSVHLSEGGKLV
jgi:hypothetical protein